MTENVSKMLVDGWMQSSYLKTRMTVSAERVCNMDSCSERSSAQASCSIRKLLDDTKEKDETVFHLLHCVLIPQWSTVVHTVI